MSTISSYFRRARKTNQSEDSVAIIAPEPVKETLKKPAITQPKEKVNKSSILYYLTAQPKKPETPSKQPDTQVNKKEEQEEKEDEEEHIACKIRHKKSFTSFWNTILEEYDDPLEDIYPLPDARYVKPSFKSNEDMEVNDPKQQNKRKINQCQVEEEPVDEVTRNVRIRRRGSVKMPVFEDYDDDEYLCKPLRFKPTLSETNKILMYMANEFMALSDNSWFQMK